MPDNKDYIQYGDYRIKINRTLGARRTTLKVAASGITLTTSLFEPRYRLERFVEDNEEFLRKATRKLEARKKKSALIDFTQSSRGYLLGNLVDIVIIEKPQSKCYLEGDVLYIEGPSVNARQTVFKRFAQRILDNFIDQFRYELLYPVPDYTLKYRFYKSRWGCCIKNDKEHRREIVMNYWCVAMPREAIRYIFHHELAHLWVSNHQKEFYRQLAVLLPDYKKGQKISKEYMI